MTVKATAFVDSILATASEGVSTTKTDTSTKTQNVSFTKIMSQSLSANVKNTTTKNSDASSYQNTSTQSTNTYSDRQSSTSTSANSANDTTKYDSTKSTSSSTSASTSASTSKDNSYSDKSDKIADDLNELADDVKDKIKETLDISDEELEDAMQILGLSDAQLLQPDNLKQLVLQISGEQDASSLLTDESLLNKLTDIVQFMNDGMTEISEDTNVSQDALQDILAQLQQNVGEEDSKHLAINADVANDAENDQNVLANSDKAVTEQVDETANTDSATDETSDLAEALNNKLTVDNQTSKGSNESSGQNSQDNNALTQNSETDTAQFSQNLAQTVQQAFQTYVDGQEVTIDTVNIVKQIVDAVKVTTTNQLQSIEIQLNPENLGKLNLTVSAKDGVITAQITAENEQVKKAIESQLTTLKQDFEEQGIKVDAIEVTVRGHEFESGQNLQGDNDTNKQNKNTKKHINLDELNDYLGEDDADSQESTDASIMDTNSSVDYIA